MPEENEIESAVLLEISFAALREKKAETLLETVLTILHERLGMQRGIFTLRQGDVFQIEASYGLEEAEKRRGRYLPGEGITGRVAESGQSALVPDIAQEKDFLNRTGSYRPWEHLAFLCAPVMRRDRVIGTLSIEWPTGPEAVQRRALRLLENIGKLAGEAFICRRQEEEERGILLDENRRLRQALRGESRPDELIGNSRAMRQVYAQIRQLAPNRSAVLLRGALGTGKEQVARALVALSTRADRPFLSLHCGKLSPQQLERELFGFEKGAFPGAVERKIGRLEAADGGTLLLEEIGELSEPLQLRLLRFLQERTFSRIGGHDDLQADVRLLAASSADLEQLIAEGKFREDFFRKLQVFTITLPELCTRRSDIVLLAEYFIDKHNLRSGKKVTRLSADAVGMLMEYRWPGNVRELENCMEYAVRSAPGDCIQSCNLPPSLQSRGETPEKAGADYQSMVESFERELITAALKRNCGNMSAAARELRLSPRMIHYNIKRLKIDPGRYRDPACCEEL